MSAEHLKNLGLFVTTHPAGHAVKGNTYPHREVLESLGGRWNRRNEEWVFDADPTARIAEAIPDTPEAPPPHYHGHRRRLRQRARADMSALPDYELLELLLFAGIRRADTKPLAKALLERFGSLAGVLAASEEEFFRFERANIPTFVHLKAMEELSRRTARAELKKRETLNSAKKVAAYFRRVAGFAEQERFHVLFVDGNRRLIADETLQTGTHNHVTAYPREVVKRALNLGADGIWLCHNHPGGNLKPSPDDVIMTEKIIQAAKGVDLVVHDHVIVTREGDLTLRENNQWPG